MNRIGAALRASFARGYGAADLRADVLAGVVVGMVALPLSMALAIASGVPPRHGLYTAIVAGIAIAGLGGSSVQVSGPTAAFVVILAPIATRFGVGGLLVAGALAGVLLILMSFAGFGQLIRFVPAPVTTGFTAGIAVVIAVLQLRDFLGLDVAKLPEHFLDRVVALGHALPTLKAADFAVGGLTLALLILWPRWTRKVPAPLVALAVGALASWLLSRHPGWSVATIGSRFSYQEGGAWVQGIPRHPPLFDLPWRLPGPEGGSLTMSFDLIRALIPSAFAIAMLGGIESLLSAVVADGMTGERHDPDSELFAQGVGNLVAPFFGGIAATGAIARTATNVRAGARSPIAAITHSIFVLASLLLLAPGLSLLPMASLAALLLLVAWNMAEAKHFRHLLQVAPRSDALVLVTCFLLTVFFDMTVAVTAGVILAALLVLRRMAQISGGEAITGNHALYGTLPKGILLYEVTGPLIFGAAQKAMSALRVVDRGGVRIVVLNLRATLALDATGLVLVEETIADLTRAGVRVVLIGVQPQPMKVLARAHWRGRADRVRVYRSIEAGLERARRMLAATAGEKDSRVD